MGVDQFHSFWINELSAVRFSTVKFHLFYSLFVVIDIQSIQKSNEKIAHASIRPRIEVNGACVDYASFKIVAHQNVLHVLISTNRAS